jgi:diguanylate cyclase (GGDEF)-like protein
MNLGTGSTTSVFRRMFVVTAISVVASFIVTLVTMRLALGDDPAATMPASELLHFGMFFSVLVPILVCPVVAYHASRLIQELRAARSEFQILAATDQLTGLLNRRGFDARAEVALESARAAGLPAAAMLCDIDHFKQLNDSLGHEFGDKCLRHIADVLRRTAEPGNFIVGRQGGDEFVVLLPGVALAEAAAIAETVRLACAAAPFDDPNGGPSPSVSIGVAAEAGAAVSLSALLRRADVALYDVKRGGRNRVVIAPWPSAA